VALAVVPVLSFPTTTSVDVVGGTPVQHRALVRIGADLAARSSVAAIELRGRRLIVTVRAPHRLEGEEIAAKWQASTVAQAVYHGRVRLHLEHQVELRYRHPDGSISFGGYVWAQPSPFARRGPPDAALAAARSAGFEVVAVREFRHGLGGMLVLRAGEPPQLVAAWHRLRAGLFFGLSSYLELQDRCGRVVVAQGWSPIAPWVWGGPPVPDAHPRLLPARWPAC
jgi:hypothetical protein